VARVNVGAEQILAFRLHRSGLAERVDGPLAGAAACPVSDFSRGAAALALNARHATVVREGYDAAVDAGELVVAHAIRGAIHALAPDDVVLYGRALISPDDDELVAQLGEQMRREVADKDLSATAALADVAEATTDALKGGVRLGRVELHAALRERLGPELLPWCKGCQSHHVAPMLWRYATIAAGARLDSERRYRLARPGRAPAAGAAAERFLRFYGPSTPAAFADWAGLAPAQARREWEAAGELAEVTADGRPAWVRAQDVPALEDSPGATGTRLLPPGDPYLQKPNRPLLAPDKELRRRLFRPIASPGAVLVDGRLAGLWRVKAKGRKAELSVERVGGSRIRSGELDAEAQRVAALRGAAEPVLTLG
jgi:Winged helix DNA-binding domain